MDNVKFWIGVVEDKNDPERRGRIRVRILGVHPPAEIQKNEIEGIGVPTDDLPWAIPTMPLTYGGVAGSTCIPPAVMPGAWVCGLSLDGEAYSNLLVLSIISVALSPLAVNKNDGDMTLASNEQEEIEEETNDCMSKYISAIESLESNNKNNSEKIGVMQISPKNVAFALSATKQKYPEKYNSFVKSSGIEIGSGNEIMTATQNQDFNKLIGKGYYSWLLDKCNDPVLAAASYHKGYGTVITGNSKKGIDSYIKKYGDPKSGKISYKEFANRIEQDGDSETANYIRDFIDKVGEDTLSSCMEEQNNIPQAPSGSIVLPTQSNVITSRFGPRNVSGGSRNHKGIDLRARMNNPIYAMKDGTVTYVENKVNYGAIYIDHGEGLQTRYLHNNEPKVTRGQKVKSGDTIALAGGRGPRNGRSIPTKYTSHLHFEVRQNGTPIDPEKYLNSNGVKTKLKNGA